MDSDDLSRILEENTGGAVPNYAGFYLEIGRILQQTLRPRTFCEVYASAVRLYNERMSHYSKVLQEGGERSDFEAFRIDFNRFKLLNGCAENLPLEMRMLISELSGCKVMGL